MSDTWKRIIVAGFAVTLVLLVATLLIQYLTYPSSQHLAVEKQYWDAIAADNEARMSRLEASSEMQHINRFSLINTFLPLVVTAVVTYAVYAYIRKYRLSAKKSVGLSAVIVTVASTIASIVATWLHYAIMGADYSNINYMAAVLGLPVVLIISFIIASIAESIYKRRNSFEV